MRCLLTIIIEGVIPRIDCEIRSDSGRMIDIPEKPDNMDKWMFSVSVESGMYTVIVSDLQTGSTDARNVITDGTPGSDLHFDMR